MVPDSPLSILGGTLVDEEGSPFHGTSPPYVRSDKISAILLNLPPAEKDDSLHAAIVSTGTCHKAGKKGTFPIYKMVPIVRIGGKWYDFAELKPCSFEPASNSSQVRYLRLGDGDKRND